MVDEGRARPANPWDNTPYGWSNVSADPRNRRPQHDDLWYDPYPSQDLQVSRPAPPPGRNRGVAPPPSGPRRMQPSADSPHTGRGRAKKKPRFDVISAFGELLVTAGVIVGLFAFWQVYVTDWQVASATDQQLESFTEDARPAPNRVSTDERTDDPPAFTPVGHGVILGALHIPEWHSMIVPVREGTSHDVIDTGAAGHYEQTAQPGEIGNFSVAAHRRSYGSNFRRIDTLNEGSVVVMETKQAWLVYRFQSKTIVSPEQSDVIAPVPGQPGVEPTERLLTMTTCHPEWGNSERYIVHFVLDHWVPRDSGIPKELAEGH